MKEGRAFHDFIWVYTVAFCTFFVHRKAENKIDVILWNIVSVQQKRITSKENSDKLIETT